METKPFRPCRPRIAPLLGAFAAAAAAAALPCATPVSAETSSADEQTRRAYGEAMRRIRAGESDPRKLLDETMAPAIRANDEAIQKRVREDLETQRKLSEQRNRARPGKPLSDPAGLSIPPATPGAPPPPPAEAAPILDPASVPREIEFPGPRSASSSPVPKN